MKLDYSISLVSCCDKYKLCDTTCEESILNTVACDDGYGVGTNITKYQVGSTRLNVVFPDGTTYNDVDLGYLPATKAYGEFQLTSGSSGAIVVDVAGVLIGNTVFVADIETTIDNLINTINGNRDLTGWYAQKVGTDTITIYSMKVGTDYNGLDVNVGISGDLTINMLIDPTANARGTECIEFGIADLYGSSTPPAGNSGPNFQDGVYEFTYIVYNDSGIEVGRETKCILFDCNVQNCVKEAVLKMADSCCSDCDDKATETILKIKSKIEQAHAQLAKGLTDCANKTIKSAGKLCTNLCLDC